MKKTILIISLCLLLGACASIQTPAPNTPINWPAQKAKLEQINHWDISGQMGVRTEKESRTASFNWQRTGQAFDFELTAPLGAASAKLHGVPGDVVLQTTKGRSFRGGNPENLLYKKTGWRIPVNALRYWVRALPSPSSPSKVKHDTYSRVASIQQGNWKIRYSHYIEKSGVELPTRISLYGPGVAVRIAISRWNIS